MRFVTTGLLLLVAGCRDNDILDTIPEPGPDGPVPDAGPDIRSCTASKCESAADCDDCDDCTTDTCESGSCLNAPNFPCGCCLIQETPGCGNSTIEKCVCALPENLECCEMDWDITCVEDVSNHCGEECGCCTPHSEPGCYDAVMLGAIAECVCVDESDCCLRPPHGTGWDSACVAMVEACGGTCP